MNGLALLQTLGRIVLWRAGPRELPASLAPFALIVPLNIAGTALVAGIGHGPQRGLSFAILDVALTLLGYALVLALAGRAHRLRQALLAEYGTALFFYPPMLVLGLAAPYVEHAPLLALPLSLAELTLIVWALLVTAHIVRSALESRLAVGFAVALSLATASQGVALLTLGPLHRGGT
jgi:hypothetical protein